MSTAAAGGGIEGAAAVGVKAANVNITGNIAGKTESKTKKQKIKELVHALVTPGFILILLALIIFVAGIRDLLHDWKCDFRAVNACSWSHLCAVSCKGIAL